MIRRRLLAPCVYLLPRKELAHAHADVVSLLLATYDERRNANFLRNQPLERPGPARGIGRDEADKGERAALPRRRLSREHRGEVGTLREPDDAIDVPQLFQLVLHPIQDPLVVDVCNPVPLVEPALVILELWLLLPEEGLQVLYSLPGGALLLALQHKAFDIFSLKRCQYPLGLLAPEHFGATHTMEAEYPNLTGGLLLLASC
mmetsp:Transcript_101723/g.283247  ORF Transcript_101723/g.283247 Transcript_101723/m.283247 type:complete len:203 (+) Transcript_101723:289-897(+)